MIYKKDANFPYPILTNTSNMQLGILWRFVFFIMKSSKYVLLSGLCKGICKIKYSYKE